MEKPNFPIIRCECGVEILLIPDIEEMSKSIQKHAEEHAREETDPEKAQATQCRIENLLISQVLKKASEK